MNKDGLRELLEREGVPRNWYCIDGETPVYEEICLEEVSGSWLVFFFERGVRRDLGTFDSESDACQFLADTLLRNLSQRRPPT